MKFYDEHSICINFFPNIPGQIFNPIVLFSWSRRTNRMEQFFPHRLFSAKFFCWKNDNGQKKIFFSKNREKKIFFRLRKIGKKIFPHFFFFFSFHQISHFGKQNIFFHVEKHTTLTIPVWSPTTVLGKPNPACLRSSDGIRNIQDGMIVWWI